MRQANHLVWRKTMAQIFLSHVTRMSHNGRTPSQEPKSLLLLLVIPPQGERIQPAATSGIKQEQARRTEPPLARSDDRKLERFGPADASPVITVDKGDHSKPPRQFLDQRHIL
jgi:hypothetical protein